jgi:HD-GYP domain-containing protein (c-di-GMP phosphodiesterase class II)
MTDLRQELRLYIVAILSAAVIAFGVAWSLGSSVVPDPTAFLLLAAFACLAQIRPLHLSSKLKIDVDDTPLFAGALLFEPAYAMALAGGAMLASRAWARREPWYAHAFNVAVASVAAGAASAVYRAVAGAGLASAKDVTAAVAAGVALYVVRTALVDLVVAMHLRRDPRTNWRRLHQRAVAQTLTLYVLGGLAALLVEVQPWALVLFVVPVALIHVSLGEVSRVRARTRAAIFELADLLDERDPYTHGHSQRVAEYAERVASHMRLSPAQIDLVRESGRLHDLGKIGTPDEVLRKPAALAGHELVAMRAHPEYGARILAKLPDFWEGAALILAHHERKDGQGYPRGLRGDEIPLEVAIVAVADAYDAMATDRPYRPALSWSEIRAELERGRGTQWDAAVVDALVETMAPEPLVQRPTVAAAS